MNYNIKDSFLGLLFFIKKSHFLRFFYTYNIGKIIIRIETGEKIMKSLQLFVCEYCGTQYKDKREAMKCENSHKTALEITDMSFHACKDAANYPDKIEVKMSDGNFVWYRR